ncbi:CHC2 zinc finger domain-containing protein [Lentzea flava]|uniref:Zinc finger CHC2-type domain-containing protein n=1 Tax=Lentzea flava TaxID=103732 RepID=A0ABQ2UPX0_9PSEU|nr:hypothetical protein GCM10010178_42660 [Lentzea flava]
MGAHPVPAANEVGCASDEPIATLIRHWFPLWTPPAGNARWLKTRCPFHDEAHASASISYEYQAFRCHGCGVKGDIIGLIREREELAFGAAQRRAEEILGGSYKPVPRESARVTRRRAFGEPRTVGSERAGPGRQVPPWLR